jgi:hypothetical protein
VPVPWLPLHSSRSSHAPRRQAANHTGSCATPPGRRPHRITRRAAPPPTSLAHVLCHPTVQLTGTRATPPLLPARPPVLIGRPPAQPFGHWSPTPGPRDANARPRQPPSPPGSCLHREGEVQPRLRSPATDECRAQVSSSPLLHGRFGGRFF